jgi:hypothetical protein
LSADLDSISEPVVSFAQSLQQHEEGEDDEGDICSIHGTSHTSDY